MAVTLEEAVQLLADAGVGVPAPDEGALPISCAQICRVLMERHVAEVLQAILELV